MLIGIMSDSHGDHLATRQAVAMFDDFGAQHLIHCGDICSISVIDELVGRPCTFVWGNCDHPSVQMERYIESVELSAPQQVPQRVTIAGKRFAVFHGHEPAFEHDLHRIQADYICHGHTHVPRDERLDGMRIINPGALYRANPRTVATLDVEADKLEFYRIG